MPGSYIIKPIEAKLNKESNWNKEMAPFCSFTFGTKQFTSDKAKFNGEIPTWNSSVTILSDAADTSSNLRLDLKDKQELGAGDILANAQINLKEIEHQGKFRNWYPLCWNDKNIGEILLESTFEEDFSNKNKDSQGSTNLSADKQFASQADVSEKSRVNEAKDTNQIKEGTFVTEGMMTEKPGQPFAMSDKQREMYNNNVPQGMNENMDKLQSRNRNDADDRLNDNRQFDDNKGRFDTSKDFGDNIGTNQDRISNNDLSANRQDDLEGKKPAQRTAKQGELNNQGRGEASAEGGLSRTDVYSETQSHIGNKMNLGLIEKQNQPQKTASGMNASAEGLNKNASPSKEQKTTEGKLSDKNKNSDDNLPGTSQNQSKSNKSGKETEYWDSKIQGLSKAEDETRGLQSGKQGFFADEKQLSAEDRRGQGLKGEGGSDEKKEVSAGMQSNYAGGSENQKLMGQNPTHKLDAEKFDV